jgi:hypothetical protein
VKGYLPDWSRTGDWITYRDGKGWNLLSPDGKTSQFLGKIGAPYLVFSRNGKLVYGIEGAGNLSELAPQTLFSVDISTLKRKDIKQLALNFKITQSLSVCATA